MASKYWIKLYHEMIDDPKVARLPDSSHRRFIECLLLAGEADNGGELPPIEDMAWRLRKDETSLRDDMSRLAMAELVEINENGRWFVTSFAKRQAPSDAAQRMKEMRKRKRLEETETEEIRIDTDTDTDTYCSVTSDVTLVTNRNVITNLQSTFQSLTGFFPPHETTDQYQDNWLQPLMAIMSQSSNEDEALKRIEWGINLSREKGYTMKSPKSIMTFALNYSPIKSFAVSTDGSVNL